MSELLVGAKPSRLRVGSARARLGLQKPGTELGATPTLAVLNPDRRLGLSPHSQGRVMDELSAASSLGVGAAVAA